MRRVCFLLGLLGCGLWYLLSGSWLSFVLLLTLLVLPWLSLLLTVPALCSFSLTPTGPDTLRVGEHGTFLLLGGCQMPMPPFQGKIQLKSLRTGKTFFYQEDRGFTPEYCGGYTLSIRKARVWDYLGLIALPVPRSGSVQLLVRPSEIPMEDVPAMPAENCVNWQPSRSAFGESYELRPYRPGDSLNRVHWKLSAKTGTLTVREAQSPVRETAGISLSLYGPDAAVNEVLGQLLWLGGRLLARNMELEIRAAAQGGTVVLHAEDPAGLLRAIDTLLCLAAPEGPALPEPGQAEKRFVLGGEP